MKSIIIYFSRADENYAVGYVDKGNTEVIAEYIRDLTGADMFKVEPVIPYSKVYDICTKEAMKRTRLHDAPIKAVPNITDYDVIYVGSPVYWGGMPEELVTALKDLDYNGKTIYPFVTHEGSGLSSIPNELEKICIGATVKQGIAIRGKNVYNSKEEIKEWIERR